MVADHAAGGEAAARHHDRQFPTEAGAVLQAMVPGGELRIPRKMKSAKSNELKFMATHARDSDPSTSHERSTQNRWKSLLIVKKFA